jgi:hypothetical protein
MVAAAPVPPRRRGKGPGGDDGDAARGRRPAQPDPLPRLRGARHRSPGAHPRRRHPRGLRYTDELAGDGTVVLRFKARVGDRELEGIDFLELDEEGRIAELTVFMRPMSALTAFNERMATRLGVTPR